MRKWVQCAKYTQDNIRYVFDLILAAVPFYRMKNSVQERYKFSHHDSDLPIGDGSRKDRDVSHDSIAALKEMQKILFSGVLCILASVMFYL